MKLTVIGCLAAAFLFAFGLAAITQGEETPGAPAGGTKGAAKEPKKPVDKTEALVTAIKEQVARAEKLVQQATEEAAKNTPVALKNAETLKLNAAKLYVAIAVHAFQSAAMFTKENEKQTFLDQYDKPNREKAIGLFLELADSFKKQKRSSEAVNLYKEVLKIDPKNDAATKGVQSAQDPGGGRGRRGG